LRKKVQAVGDKESLWIKRQMSIGVRQALGGQGILFLQASGSHAANKQSNVENDLHYSRFAIPEVAKNIGH
jgi:hypothetical protein